LLRLVPEVFRARWLPAMRREVAALRNALPTLLDAIATAAPIEAEWLARSVADTLLGVRLIVPEEDLSLALMEIAALSVPGDR
jgi:hypothetical protein